MTKPLIVVVVEGGVVQEVLADRQAEVVVVEYGLRPEDYDHGPVYVCGSPVQVTRTSCLPGDPEAEGYISELKQVMKEHNL